MNYFLLLVAYLAPSCGAFTSIRLPAPSSLSNSHGETSSSHHKERYTSVNTRLNVAKDIDDSPDAAEFLQLSSSDLSRLAAVRDRRLEMPILILEPLLPGQRLQFGRYVRANLTGCTICIEKVPIGQRQSSTRTRTDY
mmetsp:Transcript_20515/g.41803  ORF Transcript_20515/g.41803 Transcript_20515/m.41803 type:complete len:138 (+) Transcript_20515:61-474(+)